MKRKLDDDSGEVVFTGDRGRDVGVAAGSAARKRKHPLLLTCRKFAILHDQVLKMGISGVFPVHGAWNGFAHTSEFPSAREVFFHCGLKGE
ncbi:hypothetical protein [Pararhizobium qamdonense]|uniref:hypothetical protein n=1 Tax=Pararhizobium qamdonense TaxID=3031126 RepID=UPI0023E13A4D|nr:hypothetical protein [Pararhizobium qamdonense]